MEINQRPAEARTWPSDAIAKIVFLKLFYNTNR